MTAAREGSLFQAAEVNASFDPPVHQFASNLSCTLALSRSQITVSRDGSTVSIPLSSMTSIEVHQPIFGANYIEGAYRTEEGTRRFTITFYRGGATEFASAFFQVTQGQLVTGEAPHPPPHTPGT